MSRLLVSNDTRTVFVELRVTADKRVAAACEAGDWHSGQATDPCSAGQFEQRRTELAASKPAPATVR